MSLFHRHRWTKWEDWEGTYTPLGIIYPKEIRGKTFDKVYRVRECETCGERQTRDQL